MWPLLIGMLIGGAVFAYITRPEINVDSSALQYTLLGAGIVLAPLVFLKLRKK